ncbi:hypothetical protein HYPSUDRAFT_214558 [Hypholoma sublateritium FD-334 SS-4]|uniref:SEC63 domain-containing protein n=1 Tax=Hypholoma sublateritium (strain FD-334 SS-4) TaxID=945553 RepID=A0A0D2MKS3_HYPSF|nr:hypothetical protein HYPSUDRAFT_214558 [Hypholoma sublateritium FD-334 SS-4]
MTMSGDANGEVQGQTRACNPGLARQVIVAPSQQRALSVTVNRLTNDSLYGTDYKEDDEGLMQRRADIAHSAAVLLEKCQLIKYEWATGQFTSNGARPHRVALLRDVQLGDGLAPAPDDVDARAVLRILRICPRADIVFVQQSASRILHSMFEICLRRGWATPATAAVDLCKMFEKRMWGSMTPLRQFKGVPPEVVYKAEAVVSLLRSDARNWRAERYSQRRPSRSSVSAQFPKALTSSSTAAHHALASANMTDYRWDEKIHGTAETFFILVDAVDGEVIVFHNTFVLRQRYAEDEHSVSITVPMLLPVPPNYYIPSSRIKFPKPRPLLDFQALTLSALHSKEFEALYSNSIQTFKTQVFQVLYTSDENVFIGAPTGSGKMIAAEFAFLRPIHIQSFTISHFPLLMIAMSKPAYLAIKECSPSKPVITFTTSPTCKFNT